jgi:hypothetical protein
MSGAVRQIPRVETPSIIGSLPGITDRLVSAGRTPEQRLARAVLAQACRDALDPLGRERQEAAAFLTKGGRAFRFWRALAGL